jgi:hypothetical protein
VEAKGFVDSMHYYERMVTVYDAYIQNMTTEESIANSLERKIFAGPSRKQRNYDKLKTYSQNLKRAHYMLETKVQKLKASLQAYLD